MIKKNKLNMTPLEVPNKNTSRKKLGLLTKKQTRRMTQFRLRPTLIDNLRLICRRIEKDTKQKCSQAMAIEALIALGVKCKTAEILKAYSETFLI